MTNVIINDNCDYESLDCDYESQIPHHLSDEERYNIHRAHTRAFCNRLKKENINFTSYSTPIYFETISPTQSTPSSPPQSPKIKKQNENTKLKNTQKWSIAKVAEVPSMDVINLQAKTESEWTLVPNKSRKEKSQTFLTTQEIAKLNNFTRMCDSFRNNTACPYGTRCKFAHSVSQLRNRICGGCDRVRKTGSDLYINCHPNGKICGCIHIGESQENFYTRTTGIEKKATEQEMNETFIEYLNSPKESAPKKPKEVKNKSWFEWPTTFEDFKKLSIEKLNTACRLCNINVKYFPNKNRPVSKTRNMLLADLAQIAKKRYLISNEEINAFVLALKQQDAQLVKPVVSFKIDIKKLHIQEKNMIAQQIQSLKMSINRKKETVARLTSQNMSSSEIEKVNSAILEFSEKLKNLEKSLDEIQDIKKFEEKKKEAEPKQEVKVVVSSEAKKIIKNSSPSILSIISNSGASACCKVNNECKDEGWQVVKDTHSRNNTPQVSAPKRVCRSVTDNVPCRHGDKCRFDHTPQVSAPIQALPFTKRVCKSVIDNIPCRHGDKCRFDHTPQVQALPVPKTVTVTSYSKTKVCESVIRKIPCRHGDRCRYAHVKGELVVKKCDFDNNCNNYNCIYKHSFETVEEFYKKSGF